MVNKTTVLILASLVLTACADDPEKLACCKGPVFSLNTGHWTPAPADLVKPQVAGANE